MLGLGGCSMAPAHAPSQDVNLREILKTERVMKISPIIAVAYEKYRHDGGAANRKHSFYNVVSLLDRVPRISGLEWIDLFGLPDLYRTSPNGETWLIYYYDDEHDERRQRCVIKVDLFGQISSIGYGVDQGRPADFRTP
jgi:hypothetical protein